MVVLCKVDAQLCCCVVQDVQQWVCMLVLVLLMLVLVLCYQRSKGEVVQQPGQTLLHWVHSHNLLAVFLPLHVRAAASLLLTPCRHAAAALSAHCLEPGRVLCFS